MSATTAKNKLCLAGPPAVGTLSYHAHAHALAVWCITGRTQWDVFSELTRLIAEGVALPEDAIHTVKLSSQLDGAVLTYSLDVYYDQAGA